MSDDLDFAVYNAMPDEQKRQICIELLEEFGGDVSSETNKGELRHACTLPLGGHTDRNSITASINYRKLTFKCFVCGNSGGLLWWVAVNRHESVESTRRWLRETSGLTSGIDPKLMESILQSLFHPPKEDRVMPSYDLRVLDPWTRWPIHHPYLTLPVAEGGREIPPETLTEFKVGYCDRDENWRYYQRIIIPLFWRTKLVGWQARKLVPDDPEPAKYKNSPDVPRDRILYGTDEALNGRQIVVVESPMSVLRHAHHLPVVATLGASVADLQVPLLHRYDRVTLWLDNDKAGWDAMQGTGRGRKHTPGLIEKLRPYVNLFVVQSPYHTADPADMTEEDVRDLVDDAPPAVLWKRPQNGDLVQYSRAA